MMNPYEEIELRLALAKKHNDCIILISEIKILLALASCAVLILGMIIIYLGILV